MKRVLWLYNHVTLIKSEVPILRELGYEVYIPKVIPFDVSVAVDWESDGLLSIPREKIEVLNKVDFYDTKIPDDAMRVMNEYFDVAVFGIFIEPLKSLVAKYKGILVFHPFGLEDGMSYTKFIQLKAGQWLLKEIENLGSRFWFGQSYENLYEIEYDYFKKRKIDLPIGMDDIEIHDRYTGEAKKILFICPRIKLSPYYEMIYRNFKEDFKGLPYSIGGAQPIMVEGDPTVLGYLEKESFDNLYPSHSVMFYHSTNKRHIHYHPFEAVKNGLPLIFMAGGLLDKLGGVNLPGRCHSIAEARKKSKRILDGDYKFANMIRESQKILLKPMSMEFCRETWKKSFEKICTESFSGEKCKEKRRKIAFILGQDYRGGIMDYTLRLLKIFQRAINLLGDKADMVLAVPENSYSEYKYKLKNDKIDVRQLSFDKVDSNKIEELTVLLGCANSYLSDKNTLMNDGISYFEDCNFLVFLADRVPKNLFLYKPYAVFVHDYIQRYVPEIMGEYFENEVLELARASEANFSTNQWALDNCIHYAGAKRQICHKIPLFFEKTDYVPKEIEIKKKQNKNEYFVWSTNVSQHKCHEQALKGLEEYYNNGGTLDCYVTGVHTDCFDLKKKVALDNFIESQRIYIEQIRRIILKSDTLKKRLVFKGNLPKSIYYDVIYSSKFMFHISYGDNGNGAVVDAAYLNKHSVSSDYPAMRNISNELNLNISFFDLYDYKDLSSKLLSEEKMEDLNILRNSKLPEHSIDNDELCLNIYKIFKQNTNL